MNRFFRLFLDPRVLGVLGLAALAAFLFLGADALQVGLVWAAIALGVAVLAWALAWGFRRWRAHRAAARLQQDLEGNLDAGGRDPKGGNKGDKAQAEAIRQRLQEAMQTIRTSRLGERTGRAALYELPWYMIIGNPAAGKSTAIVQSGLRFPFARGTENILQGIGGTRNCDWFFSSEGILIDTAGRYSVQEEDRAEWLGFLSLLKKNRPKAPINGILIAASLAELNEARPDATIRLAKSLRQRVQELTEALEVFAPVYVLFTKADLIPGFVEFFEDRDPAEREKVWGATLPYTPDQAVDAVAQFDRHFDELQDGLKEVALAHMSLHRGQAMSPAMLAFPLEFAATKPVLRTFVATLFEENPYQHRPVFRGFYFTSAVQVGEASSRTRNGVAEQFALTPKMEHATGLVMSEHGFFLKDLFSKVIFADRDLVKQHAGRARQRLRTWAFAGGAAALALMLAGWSWSWVGNRQLVASVQADLEKAVRLQQDRVDLASRLEALTLMQDRIEELDAWKQHRPWSVGLGLYQGDEVERTLRREYFQGVRRVMLEPVAQAIEGYLGEVNQHAAELKPVSHEAIATSATSATTTTTSTVAGEGATPTASASSAPVVAAAASTPATPKAAAVPSRYAEASATDVEDAYKALKTYLMLAERQRMDSGHLTDQVTRFWRGWLEANRGTLPHDQLMRSAERLISFSMANLQDPAFPVLDDNFGLVDQTRDNLRRVVHGTPAIERVYGDVKARASTRYPSITVAGIVGEKGRAVVAGSAVVSGTFTRQAWDGYIDKAFKDAASNELQSTDWVLKTSSRDDLSLQGSPEQIRKTLTDLYKADYVREWQRFMQGVSIADFGSFDVAVRRMDTLGDAAESPIRRLFITLNEQTAWDNPSLLNERLGGARRGVVEWFKSSILRMSPASVEVKVDAEGVGGKGIPMGAIGREFAALPRIVQARDGGASLLDTYLQGLGKVRSRFNQIRNQGDAGPAARQWMAATLDGGNGSELAETLRFVDEQMLTGASDVARATLKPLLVRPLIQSFDVLVGPTEGEVNRLWAAQVLQPFQQNLAGKYPFDRNSKLEAGATEIARVFGPSGAIAKFSTDAIGPLVTRRGDAVTPRLWANLGLRLRPAFVDGLPSWIGTLDGAAGSAGNAPAPAAAGATPTAAAGPAVSTFQLLPQGAPGFVSYTVEIDGQQMVYRNGAAAWSNFVWPNAGGAPGVRLSGVTPDGRTVEVFSSPGSFGFERLIDAARVKKFPGGIRELSWGEGRQAITVQYRAVTSPGPAAPPPPTTPAAGQTVAAPAAGLRGLKLPDVVAGADGAQAPAPGAPAAPGAAPKPTTVAREGAAEGAEVAR